ncbi:hypothetical protein PZ938_13305 [Luteipulveratus sp. YIM 133132]|uniref:hypothetical protein n=1 Tax=Luteipulveratus flavus TaxID=3031728 RepID=UPI0023B097CB|nr:hypothetical protein [Luteipulveratus sp. YIM 133132]MDE9366584.1 hypothetical protein [Luteipulveratus sp. YIM 133132]
MSSAGRIGAFTVGLAAVFGVALVGGHTVGPLDTSPPPAMHGHGTMPSGGASTDAHAGHGSGTAESAAASLPGGLQVAQDAYRLVLDQQSSATGRRPVSFTVLDGDGRPVTAYDMQHEKQLHLIAVRRDLTGFQHVHPVLGSDGRWRTQLDLTPGQWRIFADFKATGGPALTLGDDLAVPGDYRPAPPARSTTTTVDGYTVTLTGRLTPGRTAPLTLSITKGGKPVRDLQPYLGAYGHLVTLREGDLAYLHVHPEGEPGDGKTPAGPGVTFEATAPSVGSYRMFLDFKHDGVVRTAELAVRTDVAGTPPATNHGATPHAH